jgi:nucleoside-diphosphate-sugar epimerase
VYGSKAQKMIAITGANGFVGTELLRLAAARKIPVVALVRNAAGFSDGPDRTYKTIGEFSASPVPAMCLEGCETVIHAAARAHRMNDRGESSMAAYRASNVEGTRSLMAAMVGAGVRKLVYISSIKVLGERSNAAPLRPDDEPRPEDLYGISKSEAEAAIAAAHAAGSIDAIIIRPVLVHGPHAKGNLATLMDAILKGRWLPFGAVNNRRSMVGVTNLADALLTAAATIRPRRSQPFIYHIADEGVLSTRRLIEILASGMEVNPRLLHIPRWLAISGAGVLGRRDLARRLFDNLEVDDRDFRRDFAWQQSLTLEEGLRSMAQVYAQQKRT